MTPDSRLATYYFAYFTYAGVLVPYFSLWLAAEGLAATQIALVLAMPQLARIFAPAAWGWLADHSGRRRAIVVFSAFAVAAGFAALYWVRSVAGMALVMLTLSALAAGAMPLVETITLAATEGRAGRYGTIRLWGSVGFIIAVLGTGLWLDHHPPSTILDLIVVLAVLVCVAALAIPQGGQAKAAARLERFTDVLRRAEVIALFGACICMSVAHGALYAFYSIYLEGAGYSKSAIGGLWTLGVVAEVLVFLGLPRLMRAFSLRQLLLASFACAALRFFAIGVAVDSLVVLIVAQFAHAATFGSFHAASIAAVHRLFSGPVQGRGMALYSSLTYGIGGAAGTLIAGWSWTALGAGPSFLVSACFGVAGALLVGWKVRV